MVITLKQYLTDNKISYEKFAKLIGKSKAQVGTYVRGVCIPKPDTMNKIQQATKNKVKIESFYKKLAKGE